MDKMLQKIEENYQLVEGIINKHEENQSKLRFNRPFIVVSDVAQQYFCEKKVEMQYIHGRVETEEKLVGTEAHEKLLEDSVKVEREDLFQQIFGEEPVFALEMLLLTRYKDTILAGRPDSILFQKGYPLIVFEYKFSKSGTVYMNHHVQARTYGIILRNMGFDTNNLFYAIIVADPKTRNNKKLREKIVEAVLMNGTKEAVLNLKDVAIHIHKFNHENAEKDLDWAIDFWNKSREAILTTNQNKCKSCEYNKECQ